MAVSIGWESRTSGLLGEFEGPSYAVGVDAESAALKRRLPMADLGKFVQKAAYLGIGLASLTTEKVGETFSELRSQAQKLADEMVARGEITADEARRVVDEMVAKQTPTVTAAKPETPRRIEITEDDVPSSTAAVDELRRQVESLQSELKDLQS
jgi:polyhydroxyalkanoate synthesis regulator phasin